MGNKYNKQLKYMEHSDIKLYKNRKEDGRNYPLDIGIALAIGYFFSHTSFLMAHDFVMVLSSIFFFIYMKPSMYKGKIRAYYKRSYKGNELLLMNIYKIASIHSITRFILLITKIVIGSIYLNKTPALNPNLFFDIITTPLTILFVVYTIWGVYFSEKYISIGDYSNGIIYRMKEKNMEKHKAITDLYNEYDDKFGIAKDFRGFKYDYDKLGHKDDIKANKANKDEEDILNSTRRVSRKMSNEGNDN